MIRYPVLSRQTPITGQVLMPCPQVSASLSSCLCGYSSAMTPTEWICIAALYSNPCLLFRVGYWIQLRSAIDLSVTTAIGAWAYPAIEQSLKGTSYPFWRPSSF